MPAWMRCAVQGRLECPGRAGSARGRRGCGKDVTKEMEKKKINITFDIKGLGCQCTV